MYKKSVLKNRQSVDSAINEADKLLQDWDDRLELGVTICSNAISHASWGFISISKSVWETGPVYNSAPSFKGRTVGVKSIDNLLMLSLPTSRRCMAPAPTIVRGINLCLSALFNSCSIPRDGRARRLLDGRSASS